MSSDAPIWIIGRNGQLACSLRDAARKKGLETLHVSRPELDFDAPERVAACLAEISEKVGQPAGIINAAAYTAVDLAEVERDTAMRHNAESPARLATFCADNGIPLIHISSDYVFSGRTNELWSESSPTEPVNVYGESKLAGERAIRESDVSALIVRTSGVFSAYGSNFLKTMLRLAEAHDEVDVVDDQISAPTPADALADCLFDLINEIDIGATTGGVLHFSGDTVLSWADFARLIYRKSRELNGPAGEVRSITSSDFDAAAQRPAFSALDCSLIRRELGLKKASLAAGVERALRRLLTNDR